MNYVNVMVDDTDDHVTATAESKATTDISDVELGMRDV